MDFEDPYEVSRTWSSTYEVLILMKFDNEMTALLIFLKFLRKCILFIFSKWKKYYWLSFDDRIALFYIMLIWIPAP